MSKYKKAVRLNEQLSFDIGHDIYYIPSFKQVKVLKEACDEGCDTFCGEEVSLVQDVDGAKYIFGASSNSSWSGFKVDDNIDVENTDILALYKNLHEIAFG